MPNNPLTQQELYDYGILRILTPPTPTGSVPSAPYFPAGYFLVPPHDVDGIVAWRKFHAGYITEGFINPDRLGTGSLGLGDLYLADDGTWKPASGGDVPNLQDVTDAGNTTTNTIDTAGTKSDYFLLDTTATPTPQTGMMFWDQDTQTPDIQLDSQLAGRVFQDEFWYVKNQTGSQINKGTVVMAVGTLGASSRILVAPMVADGSVPAKYILGIAAENIPDGGDGSVMRAGKIRQINTTAFTAGDVLYANPASPGGLTSTLPSAPNLKLAVAFVVHAATNGVLAVRVEVGSDLYEDHRVQVNTGTLATGQLLRYNSNRWENWTPNFLTTVPTLDQVTTAGNTTTNAITVGGLNVDSGTLYVDPVNNRVGIGTISPSNNLHIEGSINGSVYATVENKTSGTSAVAGIIVRNNLGSGGTFQVTSTTTTVSGVTPNAVRFRSDSAITNGIQFLTGTSLAPITFGINNGISMRIFGTTENVGIGTTTDAGYKLDVNGTTRLNGLTSINSTSVANTALTIGSTGTGAGNYIVQGYDISSNQRFYLTASGNFRINGAADNGASGIDEKFRLDQTFNPTSGTRSHFGMWLRQTINQTGGANGITRGLYVSPTLTAAADFRAIETSAGKIIHQGLTNATQTNQVYYDSTTGELTYGALPASAAITTTQISNWDTAYGWGNHASAGYLTSQPWVISGSNIYYNTGNVGIGATSPTSKLDVVGTFRVIAAAYPTTSGITVDTDGYVVVGGTVPEPGGRALTVYGWSVFKNNVLLYDELRFGDSIADESKTYFIKSGGAIEINANIQSSNNTFDNLTLRAGATNTSAITIHGNFSSGRILFQVLGSERMRISDTGNLLIGTTTDGTYKLDVNGTARVSSTLTANSFVKSGGTSSQFLKADGSVDTNVYVNNSSFYDWNWRWIRYANTINPAGGTASQWTDYFKTYFVERTAAIETANPTQASGFIDTRTSVGTVGGFGGSLYGNIFGDLSSYHAHIFTNIYVEREFTVNVTNFSGDDAHALFIDGVFVVGNTSCCTDTSYSYTFKQGWHRIDLIYTEGSGGDYIRLGWNPKDYPNNITQSNPYYTNYILDSSKLWIKSGNNVSYSTGNVLIGTTTDSGYKLDVVGTVKLSNLIYTDTTNSRVGINTSSPNYSFEVVSTNGKVLLRSNAEAQDIGLYFSTPFTPSNPPRAAIIGKATNNWNRIDLYFCSNNVTGSNPEVSTADARMVVQAAGNVGIGTTTPGYKLEVIGTLRASGATYASGGLGVNLTGGLTSDFDVNGFAKVRIDLQVDRRLYVNDFIYVGTSTFSGYKMDVNGVFRNTSDAYFATTSGNVGIGTTSPTAKLDVRGRIYVEHNDNNYVHGVIVRQNNTTSSSLSGFQIMYGSTSVAEFNYRASNFANPALANTVVFNSVGEQKMAFIANTTVVGAGQDIYFRTRPDYQNGIIIFGPTGNVGMNTATDAGYKLDVNGTARIQGNIDAQTYNVNGTAGWTGTITIPTNPPGQQNIAVNSGIITNVF